MEHVREYNSAMVFAPMGAEIKSPLGSGPFCFWIHGQIYRLLSPLYSNEANKLGYGHIVFYVPLSPQQKMR
jgi:hypothetical protein